MKQLRASQMYDDSIVRVIALESVDLQRTSTQGFHGVHATVRPIGVIVSGLKGTYAIDMNSKPVDIAQLKRDIPELDNLLA